VRRLLRFGRKRLLRFARKEWHKVLYFLEKNLMRPRQSTFRSNFSSALDELLNDVDQIKSIIANPKWKKKLSASGKKNEVLLSRLVFDLSQANNHINKTREQIAGIISQDQNSFSS